MTSASNHPPHSAGLAPHHPLQSPFKRKERITFDQVKKWSIRDVQRWLRDSHLPNYDQLIQENDITGDILLELDYNLLKELNIPTVGERMKVLIALRKLKEACAQSEDLPSLVRTSSFDTAVKIKSQNESIRRFPTKKESLFHNYNHSKYSLTESLKSIEEKVKDPFRSKVIKVIGPDGENKKIDIGRCLDVRSILDTIIDAFGISGDLQKYSLFTITGEQRSARILSDQEILSFLSDSHSFEKEKLFLRKKHQPMAPTSNLSRQQSVRETVRKLGDFLGPKLSQKYDHQKSKNYFGERPPSEMISSNLEQYFPGNEEKARNSIFQSKKFKFPSISPNDTNFLADVLAITEKPSSPIKSPTAESPTWQPDGTGPRKWIKGALIGTGSFGSVFLGLNAHSGELMAIKQVEIPKPNSSHESRKRSMLEALQREVALLKDLSHENIVHYLGSQMDLTHLNIFLEYVPGGSVAALLSNYGSFEETLIRSFVRQILNGLSYLHELDIIHRDIKGGNILVDNKGGVKISDFGISKKVEDASLSIIDLASLPPNTGNRNSLQGSAFWMAPEVVKHSHYTRKADIWSLGCVIIEMFTGTHPFPDLTEMQAIFKIGTSAVPCFPENISKEAEDFLHRTFQLKYSDRPSAEKLLKHPFILQSKPPDI